VLQPCVNHRIVCLLLNSWPRNKNECKFQRNHGPWSNQFVNKWKRKNWKLQWSTQINQVSITLGLWKFVCFCISEIGAPKISVGTVVQWCSPKDRQGTKAIKFTLIWLGRSRNYRGKNIINFRNLLFRTFHSLTFNFQRNFNKFIEMLLCLS